MTNLTDVVLVWGTPGDVELTSDGGGDWASTFRLTPAGAAKVAQALGATRFRDAEMCGHTFPGQGDDVHVAGEPVPMICLASPLIDKRDADRDDLAALIEQAIFGSPHEPHAVRSALRAADAVMAAGWMHQ